MNLKPNLVYRLIKEKKLSKEFIDATEINELKERGKIVAVSEVLKSHLELKKPVWTVKQV